MACMGCGGEVSTAGCINSDCAYSVGGTYLNGKKMHTASGRPLFVNADWPCTMYGPLVTRCRHQQCKPSV